VTQSIFAAVESIRKNGEPQQIRNWISARDA
jgi:hypothetical protein